MRKLIYSLSLLTVLGLASCKEAVVEPDPVIEPSIKAGSTFTFAHNVYDDDTTWTNLSTTDTATYTVASIDTTFASQLNAHYLWGLNDTSVYRLDAQKNLAVYQPEIPIPMTGVSYPESWPAVPIATKEALVIHIDEDTLVMMDIGGGQKMPAVVETRLTSGYTGLDSLTINGKTYATQKGFIARRVTVGAGGYKYYTDVYTEYSYSPELKTIVARRQKVNSNHDQSPIPNGGETWTLVRFKL